MDELIAPAFSVLFLQQTENVCPVFLQRMGSFSKHTGYAEKQVQQTQEYVTLLFNKKGAFHQNSFQPLSGTDDMSFVVELRIN